MNPSMTDRNLINELQTRGLRLTRPDQRHVSRRGGAGPTDHQAMTIGDTTVMVPVFTETAMHSPFVLDSEKGQQLLQETPEGLIPLADVSFASDPAFYSLSTADGIPYQQIATLHGRDVLATTVLQTCIRYQSRRKTCQFCSIGQSLSAGRTVERKTPEQLAEVAKAAVELDGVKHMVMTTGTPGTSDRGAAILAESVAAVKAAVDLPVQVQCEPPDDDAWFTRLKDAGADAIGMHLEAVTVEGRVPVVAHRAGQEMILDVGPLDTRFRTNEGAGFEMIGRAETGLRQDPAAADQELAPGIEFGIQRDRPGTAKLEVEFEVILQVFAHARQLMHQRDIVLS